MKTICVSSRLCGILPLEAYTRWQEVAVITITNLRFGAIDRRDKPLIVLYY